MADLQRGGGMCHAEKLWIARHNQVTPTHTHTHKAEDIINGGGARLAVELYGSDANGQYDPTAGGAVQCDGLVRPFRAGEVILLARSIGDAAAGRLARLLGRRRRCAGRRGVDSQ